ncbi:hypothetical protein [Streptosporangium sp. NPDC051022]|uniref:hypothetical protein n=1 Tax=Streptosporangium sp. NPDC051022 TaxID=3155752 RepID=UPI00343B9249
MSVIDEVVFTFTIRMRMSAPCPAATRGTPFRPGRCPGEVLAAGQAEGVADPVVGTPPDFTLRAISSIRAVEANVGEQNLSHTG